MITIDAVRLACKRFTLTDPVELDDMGVIARHLRSVFPGVSVEVYRHRADLPVYVRVDAHLIYLTPTR